MHSFLQVDKDSPFSLANVPFGVISTVDDSTRRASTRIGDTVIDLRLLSRSGFFDDLDLPSRVLEESTLNALAGLDAAHRRAVRSRIQSLFSIDSTHKDDKLLKGGLLDAASVKMHLPVDVGDYTDFCASAYHTRNMGRLIDTGGPSMPRCWPHLPIGYHGRSSSIVVSGTPIRRPSGARPGAKPDEAPSFGPCRALDYELEMAAILGGKPNELGERLTTNDVEENVFGVVIMNDWSARDIQGYEMVPLGPFVGKNFGTSISPWVVTLDALKPFKAALQDRVDEAGASSLMPYLVEQDPLPNFDVALKVTLRPPGGNENVICESNMRYLSYSFGQMLAHQTVGGCPIKAGDMLASGTISGPSTKALASLAELGERGAKPFKLDDGTERRFLNDGDSITISAVAVRSRDYEGVGFGQCVGTILPSKP